MISIQGGKITQLTLINYYFLKLSERALATIFQDCQIKIYLLQPREAVINMITGKDQAFIREKENMMGAIDDLEISSEGKDSLKKICQEVSGNDNDLQSVFSEHSSDISFFHSPEKPYYPFIFEFQLLPGAETYVPIKEKCRYVNPSIEPQVSENIDKLLEIGVIYSGFSDFNAQSIYIPKKLDKTLEEHLQEGN